MDDYDGVQYTSDDIHIIEATNQNTNSNLSKRPRHSNVQFIQLNLRDKSLQIHNWKMIKSKETILLSKSMPLLPIMRDRIPQITLEKDVLPTQSRR
jgi:hypothetical protein